ncbi:MAG: lipid-A-disaccharide synthase [Elusimicrobia bacterium]|nr:lipid-A-disaccharide synthase [Elusimicrobiota bacterium]
MKRVLIAAGDPSGDLYASMLVAELRRRSPGITFAAVAGPLTRSALGPGDEFLEDLASLGVTGFVEPVRRLPRFARLRGRLDALLARGGADAVLCIDFWGFNSTILEAARARKVPAYYFISPQVWASRPGRVARIKKCVRKMLVIFPFEETLYRQKGVPVKWVGHPLLDLLPTPRRERPLTDPLRLGLLPGSRLSELRRHLPLFLSALGRIARDYPSLEVTVFAAQPLPDLHYRRLLAGFRLPGGGRPRIVRETDYAERARQDLVLSSSGTATLENALLGLPMVVVYKLSWPTYLLARALIKVRHIAMPNLLAGKALVPELIQHEATPAGVAAAALGLLEDPRRLYALRAELLALRELLGGPGAIARAAETLLAEPALKSPLEALR